MTGTADRPWREVYPIPSFLDRLEDAGGLTASDMVDLAEVDSGDDETTGRPGGGVDYGGGSPADVGAAGASAGGTGVDATGSGPGPAVDFDGVIYHDRGIRVPGYDATFVREEAGSRDVPAFSVEIDAVGSRSAWAVFDASLGWDVALLVADDAAAIAWMNDGEFVAEEAGRVGSKRDALAAGRFSFGVFLYGREAWTARVRKLERTRSPAYLLHDDGSTYFPPDQPALYDYVGSTPEAFRRGGGGPDYLGVLELEISIAE